MATLDFSLLGLNQPGIAERFYQGQQEAQRNLLAQQQLAHAQQQNELARFQIQQAQREAEVQNKLMGLDQTAPDYISRVTQLNPKLGAELELRAAQKATAERQAKQAEAQTQKTGLEMWQAKARDLAVNPSDIALQQLAKDAVRLGVADMATATAQYQQMLSLPLEQRASILSRLGAQAVQPEKPRTPTLMSPEEEAQKIRIALASRPPAQPREPAAPVAIYDEAAGKVKYVPREEAIGRTPATAMEGLAPKEIQKREASFPQATSAIKGFETKSDAFIKDLEALRDDPGLDNITGPVFGRTPSVSREGSRAQALYDKIVAKGGFQALQDLRDASKTGGALGNVSNQEGKQLTASFAAIDRRQNAADVRAAIDQAIADIKGSKTRMREAYDATYSYKRGGAGPAAAPSSVDALLEKYK